MAADTELDKAGARPEVEITFGHAQKGYYTVDVFDATGTVIQTERGRNADHVEDKFFLKKDAADLVGHVLSWDLKILAPSDGPGQTYSAEVIVSQAGTIRQRFPCSGDLDGVKVIFDDSMFT